jgi:protein involved in polysaccharide export with SLBB domain
VLLGATLAAGCTGPGGRFTLFPDRQELTEQAQVLRAATPEPVAFPRELDKRVQGPYTVEPGDVLLAQPANLDSPVRLPGDQPVLPDGTIYLGRYGHLAVAGKTLVQIEADVNAVVGARVKDAGPITVRLVTRDSKVYYVLGEVNAPGAFQLRGRETVLDAILAAGGLNSSASRRNIILSRPTGPGDCRVVLPICYSEIVQLGDTSTNYQIKAGDRVFVPGRSLLEELWPKKQECLPCGAPQTPCALPVGQAVKILAPQPMPAFPPALGIHFPPPPEPSGTAPPSRPQGTAVERLLPPPTPVPSGAAVP